MGRASGSCTKSADLYFYALCRLHRDHVLVCASGRAVVVLLFTQDAALRTSTLGHSDLHAHGLFALGIQYEIVDGFTAIGQVQLSLPLSFSAS